MTPPAPTGPARLGLPDVAATPLGGTRGRYAVPFGSAGAPWAPLIALSALPVVLGLIRQAHCLGQGWGGNTPIYRGCYSDLIASLQTAHTADGLASYLAGHVGLEDPPLASAVVALVGGLSPGSGSLVASQRWFVLLWALLALALTALMALLVATARGHRGVNPAVVAVSPVLGLTVLMGADIVPAALVAGGLWAWSRHRMRLTGALLGLAVLAGLWPAVILAAVVVLAERAGRHTELRRLLQAAAVAVAAPAVFWVAAPGTFVASVVAWWEGPVGNGSPWYLFTLAGFPLEHRVAAALAMVGWGGAVATTALLARKGLGRPSLAQVSLVAVGLVLVTGKSFPVQASLVLVPLVAFAGLRWRTVLLWWLAEAVHYAAVWMHVSSFSDPNHALPGPWYAVAMLGRLAAVLLLVHEAWSAGWYPRSRPAAIGTSEPQAGTLVRLPSATETAGPDACGGTDGADGDTAYPPVTEGP